MTLCSKHPAQSLSRGSASSSFCKAWQQEQLHWAACSFSFLKICHHDYLTLISVNWITYHEPQSFLTDRQRYLNHNVSNLDSSTNFLLSVLLRLWCKFASIMVVDLPFPGVLPLKRDQGSQINLRLFCWMGLRLAWAFTSTRLHLLDDELTRLPNLGSMPNW